MAEYHQQAAIIELLIKELRSVLLRWDTSVLKGQMIIKFGNTSAPDISYQTTACTSNLGSELPPKIYHYPSLPNLSNFSKEHSFWSSKDPIDPTTARLLSQTFPSTCNTQDGSISERRKSQTFDSVHPTMILDVTHLTLKEKCLSPYESVTSSHFSYSTTCTPSNLPYSSSVSHESTLPPFENIMLEKKSHSVDKILNDSENVHGKESGKIQTLPQTCCNNLNTFYDVPGERSSPSFNHLVKEIIDSHPSLSRVLGHEMNSVSSSVDSSAHEDSSYTEKMDMRNKKMSNTNIASLNAIDKVLAEMNLRYSRASSCLRKRIEDNNGFESAFKEGIVNDENKRRFSCASETSDGQISAVDLQRFSHSELLKILVNLLHLKETRQNESTSLHLGSQIPYPQEMKTPSSQDCEDKSNKRQCLSPKVSTPDKVFMKNTSLSSAKANERTRVDSRNSARKEVILELEQQPKSRDTNLEKDSGYSDSDRAYSQSVSVQNVKPLKKRTRLCTNIKELNFKSNETERQDLPGKTNSLSQQSPIHLNKEKSADAKQRISVKQKNIKKTSFVCKICKNNFTTRNDYRQHLRSHNGSFKCNVCGKVMKTKDSLYHHQRGLHSKEKPYHCKDCGISFNFHHSYKLHLQKHRGERPHKCQYCEKGYLTSYHLKEHIQAVHSNASIVCHVCGKKFSYSSALKLHLHRHSGDLPHKCSLCLKRFATKHALKVHSISHIKERNFQCETCGKCFKSEYSRNFHSKKHKKQLKQYMCEICGKTFIFKCILDSHVQIHSKVRPYICNKCGKTFKSKASLYTHQYNVHKEGPMFPCSICGKLFKTKRCLAAHVKRHQNENIYSCSTCRAIFPDKGGLSKHMKTVHLPRKCFICKICGKIGTRGDNMRTHVKSHKNEVHSSNNLMDFIKEEMTTERFSDFHSLVMKVRQRTREPKHRSGRKLYPTVQTSDQNRWTPQQPGLMPCVNVSKTDLKPNTSMSSISVLPVLSQGPMTRASHNNFHMRESSDMFSQSLKEYNGSFLSSDQSKSTSSQIRSYFCQPDMATNSNSTNNLAFPTGSLTSLLSSINGTPEPEAPPPYSFIRSPHHHNYQTAIGNSHSSAESIISRPVESLNMATFGINHEQTMTTLQNVPLRIPPHVEESQVSSTVNNVQEGI